MLFNENIGQISLLNGEIIDSKDLSMYENEEYKAYYEVIRIIDKVPLFYEEHYARLSNSIQMGGRELEITKAQLREQISEVCKLNNYEVCNIKVIVLVKAQEVQKCILFINKFYYPPQEQYDKGIKCSLANVKRTNPNIKMINHEYKETVKKIFDENDCFEVLLVDDCRITEGSKSNAFFVIGKRIYTAPGDYVLKGITRQYVLDVSKNLGYELIETLIGLDTLNKVDAAFITGTSINVLPIAQIDDLRLDSSNNDVVRHMMHGYNEMLANYVKIRQK